MSKVPGGAFGDTSSIRACNNTKKKVVVTLYKTQDGEPIFAAHNGTVNIYTSVNLFEDNQANDAIWINGESLTTNYIGLRPIVQTGQYIYAGQLIGRVYRENYGALFGFGIRMSPPVNPIHKRRFLPSVEDKINSCVCNDDPVWPEYFVDPASPFIAFDRYNDFFPEASLKITTEPGGIGRWSFDNGVTWLPGGEKISGLPFGYYKIIFKTEYGYTSPSSIQVKIVNSNKDFVTTVKYTPDYTILKKPEAVLQREADQKQMDTRMAHALDSLNTIVNANDKTTYLKNSIIDSLNRRFTKIEEIQKETFFFTRLFKYILPILLLAILFTIILLFQNNKIRRQKRYLENLQKEQHHRVHNSLSLVSSLLNKYKNNINPEKLADIDNSIIAISTVHRQLYKGSDLENINFQPVLEHIAGSLLTQKELGDSVMVHIDAHVIIPQKKSTTLALIFNELFTNSLKYAFRHTEGKAVFYTVTKQGDQISVLYRDNGNGYPNDFLKRKTAGFGRVLLEGLAHQLRAKINFYNKDGACCMIKL
ncbi:hypothetical protein GCM10027516_35500 [Niabella aquatica]